MNIVFQDLPKDYREFETLASEMMESPLHTVALFLLAYLSFEGNPEESVKMMNLLKGDNPLKKREIIYLKNANKTRAYIAKSYFIGATANNHYQLIKPLTLDIQIDRSPPTSEGMQKLYVRNESSGSDRVVIVRRKGGKYFIWDYSNLLLDVKDPNDFEGWD
ncbi:MAG: hypothetical protein LLG09_08270 [Negativicutes bacterium]|nr:hypothetical protein [Negativicutes bacterium]